MRQVAFTSADGAVQSAIVPAFQRAACAVLGTLDSAAAREDVAVRLADLAITGGRHRRGDAIAPSDLEETDRVYADAFLALPEPVRVGVLGNIAHARLEQLARTRRVVTELVDLLERHQATFEAMTERDTGYPDGFAVLSYRGRDEDKFAQFKCTRPDAVEVARAYARLGWTEPAA